MGASLLTSLFAICVLLTSRIETTDALVVVGLGNTKRCQNNRVSTTLERNAGFGTFLSHRNADLWGWQVQATEHIPTSSTLIIMMGQRGKRIRQEKKRSLQEPTPPRILTPYGPIRFSQPAQRSCDCCRGRGLLRCEVCSGRGVIRATGTNSKNLIESDRLIGSQWTSVEVYNGHRHHVVIEVQGSPKKPMEWQVRMQNCCGEEQNRFWISVSELKNKGIWRKGWQTLVDIEKANGGPLHDVRVCFCCKGNRVLLCVDCDGKGSIPSYEQLHD